MCRILVVDDEPDVVDAIRRRLEREGYDAQTAATEAEAKELIAQAPSSFDVIVTDMVMESDRSGEEILRAAFARDLFAEVIVLTAYGSVRNAVECMKRGAFDYVEKNIPDVDVYDLLVMRVQQAIEHRRSSVDVLRRVGEPRGRPNW
jgi:DNA-binding NtrC family response regulator